MGVTLVEVLIASVILMIVVLGAAAFRYNAALGARKADLHIAAARTALLLSEAWLAAPEPNAFDPTSLSDAPGLLITPAAQGPPAPAGSVSLGKYAIFAQDLNCFATLSWGYDLAALPMRALNIVVAWQPQDATATEYQSGYKLFRLTTYALD